MATNKNKKTAAAQAAAETAGGKKSAVGVLEGVGRATLVRHGLREVFVTSDGQAFPLESDARHHAADLTKKEIIKVTEQ